MTEWLWDDEKSRAWVVGYFNMSRKAIETLRELNRSKPRNVCYALRLQIIGIESKEAIQQILQAKELE